MAHVSKIASEEFRSIDKFTLFDLEMVRLILRGGTIFDWQRLNLSDNEIESFFNAHRIDLNNSDHIAMIDRLKEEAIAYLKEQFEFPVPKPMRAASLQEILSLATRRDNRHRQLCACMLLKAIHIINHFDAKEARQAIKMTDQELFLKAEEEIYRTISHMMAECLPVVEFMGGRKQRSSMVTKLLSKTDPLSAQLFDKMRFRIVTASKDDILPTLGFLSRTLFPFNYVLGDESYNTLFPFADYCNQHESLQKLMSNFQIDSELENKLQPMSNAHSSPRYRVIHWVADMPLLIPDFKNAYHTDGINPVPRPIIYVRAEIQMLDRKTHRINKRGDASHKAYKKRQRDFVADRLKVGLQQFTSRPPE